MSLLIAAKAAIWAIIEEKHAAVMAVLERHEAKLYLTAEEIAAISKPGRPSSISGGIQVLPLFGTIAPRANMITDGSGGTSAETFTKNFRAALADPNVGAIVIDVDSPGGTVQGVDETANEVFKARGVKPVVAVANHLAASAAYWIATAAEELVVTPSGEVGSIGVFAAHDDYSKSNETIGVKRTYIKAGKYKTEANPDEPLNDEAMAAIQKRVDEYYGMFTKAVARNRGVSVDAVRNGYGEGRVVGAQEALRLGMVDRVATFDETIARLQKRAKGASIAQADLDFRQRRARAITGFDYLAAKFKKSDRVRILEPHMPGHKSGVIDSVSPDTAYAIVIDGMAEMGAHKWYVDSELELIS